MQAMSSELSTVKRKLSNNKAHQTSVKKYRDNANEALSQRNVVKDKLQAMQYARDRWQAKYVVGGCKLALLGQCNRNNLHFLVRYQGGSERKKLPRESRGDQGFAGSVGRVGEAAVSSKQ